MKKSKIFSIIAIALALTACDTKTPVHTDEIATTDATTAVETVATSAETVATTEVTEAPSTTEETLELNIVDGVLYFHPETKVFNDPDGKVSYYEIMSVVLKTENVHYRREISRLAFGDVMADVYFEESGNSYSGAYCYMTSIGAFGYTLEFDEALSMSGPYGLSFYAFDDVIATEWSGNSPPLKHWFFTEEGIIEFPQELKDGADKENGYDDMIYELSKRDDGRVGYRRTAAKSYSNLSAGDILEYCVSLDEFCYEKGYIIIENGGFVFCPEITKTFFDRYGIEYTEMSGIDIIAGNFEWMLEHGIAKGDTLEEHLAENAKLYPRVY